jgi:hypothetical protein
MPLHKFKRIKRVRDFIDIVYTGQSGGGQIGGFVGKERSYLKEGIEINWNASVFQCHWRRK